MRSHHDKHWASNAVVRTGDELTTGEKAADVMRSSMGSWPFVGGFLLFMGVWAVTSGFGQEDPFPYILLNLFLSMLAGLQGAILLISAKRQDAVASALAQQHYQISCQLEKQMTELRKALEGP
jgi:uncharacterized membrane protein